MARDLISKLLAAGLSAGVFLIWWPEHHPTAGLMSLVVRGALWTLLYELLLVTFAPLERTARRAVGERLSARRLPALPARIRLSGACALACAGAALPVALLAHAHAPRPPGPVPAPRRVVIVKRPIVRQRVVVRREVVTVPTPERFVTPAPASARPAAKTPTARVRRTPKVTSSPTPPAPATTTTPAAPAPAGPAPAADAAPAPAPAAGP